MAGSHCLPPFGDPSGDARDVRRRGAHVGVREVARWTRIEGAWQDSHPRPSRHYLAAAIWGASSSSQGPGKRPLDRPSPENTLSWRAH